jgi:hypothetical protein
MSALPPKADMLSVEIDVCLVPIADMVITRQFVDHAGRMVSMSSRTPQFEPHFVGRHIDYGEPNFPSV